MLMRLTNGLKRKLCGAVEQLVPVNKTPKPSFSQRGLLAQLSSIPHWEKKINYYKNYIYDSGTGEWRNKNTPSRTNAKVGSVAEREPLMINYGCGGNLVEGWLNIDLHPFDAPNYRSVNLLEKHPFEDNSISFGFSEDMLEHLTQAESIFLIGEIYRTLKPGGVMRFSFPGLEGVLKRHYTPASEPRLREGEFEAYSFWDHIHFYSKEELRLVATHIGFKSIEFVNYGESRYPQLAGRDTRQHQIDLNTFVELAK